MKGRATTAVEMLINGRAADTISALDRGLHYGDGLFETLAIKNGLPVHWERHLQRLMHGCERLSIAAPDIAALTLEAQRLCAGQDRAVLKIIVTRGIGGRGYRPLSSAEPTRIMMRYPWPDYPAANAQDGVCVRLCRTRLGSNSVLADLKHLNRLEQVLARSEWADETIAEGLMFDQDDHVIEGTMSNLFLVRGGQLITADVTNCGVAGILRGLIIEWAAQQRMVCTVRAVPRDELFDADELLLCNSVIGIWPVRAIDAHRYSPGPVTRTLMQAMDQTHG